jgi:response regulator RpfG family c-di-GMP phosphodiesterase
MSKPATLLMVNAFIGTSGYKKLYRELGYAVVAEWSERKAISFIRRTPPDVIVADFYHQTDFRDRLSNLESLLAAVQSTPRTRILVLYEIAHQAVLEKVSARLRIDAALTLPVQESELRTRLQAWFRSPPVSD